MFTFWRMATICALAQILAPVVSAHAQSAGSSVSEVIVTATKTGATDLQKTPLSVAVLSGADLDKSNVRTLKDLTQLVPSLTITQQTQNAEVYVRGVGGNNGNADDTDVGVYLDGVYLSRPKVIMLSNFNDLDRIEVVEGPQGTLFGRNSAGGAINFISRPAPDTFQFQNTLNLGNYALIDEAFTIGGPVADKLKASLAYSHVQHDGYEKNVFSGGPDPDEANRNALRAQLRWEPTANITNTVRADYFYTDENWVTGAAVAAPPPYPDPLQVSIIGDYHKVDMAVVPTINEQSYGLSDELNWKINDNLTLKSVSALRTDHNDQLLGNIGTVFRGFVHSADSQEAFTQEFNLIHNFGPVSGVVGLYYFNEHLRFIGNGNFPGGNVSNPNPVGGFFFAQTSFMPTVSKAVFFEETYHFTPTFGVTVGGRYTDERRSINTDTLAGVYAPGFPQNGNLFFHFIGKQARPFNAFTPKVAVHWQATPDTLLYASTTRGFKSGGYNFTLSDLSPGSGASYNPETIWAYEIGAKTDWFDHKLRANVALFRYDWKGLQFSSLIAPTVNVVANAGAATINGLELNLTSKPVKSLTLSGGLTLLDTNYDDFKAYGVPGGIKPYLAGNPKYNAAAGSLDASGNQIVNAPKVSLNVAAQKDFDLAGGSSFYVRGEYQYASRTFFDPSNVLANSRGAYGLVHASIGYTPAQGHWSVALWGRNLTDKVVRAGYAGGSPPLGHFVTNPRTFGIRINYTR